MKFSPLTVAFLLLTASAWGNDQMFPPTPAAEKAIDWKGGAFLVKGEPTFLAAGEIHYARVPRELWADRLWRAKMMGLNTIQTYIFWNAQEGRPGVFDFTDNLDLDAWLTTIQSEGMYAVVRPGPYNCAEWENGGLPAWLTTQPGMRVREDYPPYVKAAQNYLDRIWKIVAPRQIHRGGPVLMAQLENEYPGHWGTDGNPFLKRLYDHARKAGMEVPLFFSGLHHGNDPAGGKPFGLQKSPWYSTEFWTGWIAQYGDMSEEIYDRSVRGTWKIIAFGGAGYDFYVVHGGSNFGYSRGHEEGAAYDYSAPIGQAGQLRKAYFPMRRASSFATTFSSLLALSVNDGRETVEGVAPGLRLFRRNGPDGSAIFLDNRDGPGAVETKVKLDSPAITFPQDGTLRLAPREIRAVAMLDVPWTKTARFASLVTGVLGHAEIAGTDYWVCYGQPGEGGEVTIQRAGKPPERIAFEYPDGDAVREYPAESGDGRKAVFLVMNTALADRTWLVPGAVVIGPHFVKQDGTMEFPLAGGGATVYSAKGKQTVKAPAVQPPALPVLGSWTQRDAAPEALPGFNDSAWPSASQPLSMENWDHFQNGYGWYRVTFDSAAEATVQLTFEGSAGPRRTFLNGSPAKLDALPVKKGKNTLAILAMSTPRPKMYNFVGLTKTDGFRGVWGKPTTGGNPRITWGPWRFQGGLAGLDETPLIGRVTNWPAFLSGTWAPATTASGPVFWRTDFPYLPATGLSEIVELKAEGLRRGHLWLNGHNLGPVPDKSPIYLPAPWLQAKNTLVIFDTDGASPRQVQLQRGETWVTAPFPAR